MREYLNNKALYRAYYIAVIALFAISAYGEKLLTGEPEAAKIIIALVASVYVAFLISSSKIVKLIMSTAVLASIVGTILIGGSQIREWFENYIYTLQTGAVSPDELLPVSYQYAQIILVVIAAGIVAILIDKLAVIKYITAIGLIALLIWEMSKETDFSHPGTVFAIAFIFTVLLELIQKSWKKRVKADIESYIVSLLPVIIVYMLVMLVMPNSDKPYDWHYTRGMYERICDKIDKIHFNFGKKNEENFVTSMAGFSDSNNFFGDNEDNQNFIMTIKGDSRMVSNLYLTGRIYDTFYGNGWSQTREETAKDRFIDTMETFYAVRNYDKEHMGNYIVRSKINVTFGNYHSGYTFMPLKTLEYFDDDQKMILYSEENVLTSKRRDYGDKYSFAFYQINMKPERIDDLVEVAGDLENEDTWKSLLGGYKIYSFGYDAKMKYDQKLKEDYSQIINLSEGMTKWVNNALYGVEGDYQKLKKLEEALNQFEYDMHPGALPESVKTGEDFLDYFVLESQRGYCTYFATAFTLLARSQGYPARYVEGFCVPMIDETARVTGRMAHAWSEVYIDGFGWIPFEPTPGYGELRYTSWDGNSIEEQKEAAREKYLELQNQMNQEEDNETQDTELQTNNDAGINQELLIFICRLIGIILASIDCCAVVIMFFAWLRYSRLTLAEKYSSKVNENLRLMSFMGIRRNINETFEEYRCRIDEMDYFNAIIDTEFLTDYEYVLYGNHEATEEYLDRACKANAKLKDNLFVFSNKKKQKVESNQ